MATFYDEFFNISRTFVSQKSPEESVDRVVLKKIGLENSAKPRKTLLVEPIVSNVRVFWPGTSLKNNLAAE